MPTINRKQREELRQKRENESKILRVFRRYEEALQALNRIIEQERTKDERKKKAQERARKFRDDLVSLMGSPNPVEMAEDLNIRANQADDESDD